MKIGDSFKECELCVGDKHFMKNSMIEGSNSNYLKSRKFFEYRSVISPLLLVRGNTCF